MWMIATDVLKSSLNHQVPEKSRMIHLNLIRQYICVTTMWHPATFIRHKWRLYFYQINLCVRVYVHSSVLICFRFVLSFVTFAPCLFSIYVVFHISRSRFSEICDVSTFHRIRYSETTTTADQSLFHFECIPVNSTFTNTMWRISICTTHQYNIKLYSHWQRTSKLHRVGKYVFNLAGTIIIVQQDVNK